MPVERAILTERQARRSGLSASLPPSTHHHENNIRAVEHLTYSDTRQSTADGRCGRSGRTVHNVPHEGPLTMGTRSKGISCEQVVLMLKSITHRKGAIESSSASFKQSSHLLPFREPPNQSRYHRHTHGSPISHITSHPTWSAHSKSPSAVLAAWVPATPSTTSKRPLEPSL